MEKNDSFQVSVSEMTLSIITSLEKRIGSDNVYPGSPFVRYEAIRRRIDNIVASGEVKGIPKNDPRETRYFPRDIAVKILKIFEEKFDTPLKQRGGTRKPFINIADIHEARQFLTDCTNDQLYSKIQFVSEKLRIAVRERM
ncbi:MAG: hypothetical protein ABI758_06040 [Candidatus Woesebacteria bacterium]